YKTLKRRASLIFKGSLSSFAPPLVSILFSLIVIKLSGKALWGSFVYYFLSASLASIVMNWGNREYLLREFSRNPPEIPSLWLQSFTTRALLIIPLFAVFCAFFIVRDAVNISAWTFLLFICQSFDSLVSYHRKFILSFIAEISSGLLLFLLVISFRNKVDFPLLITFYLASLILKAVFYLAIFRNDVFEGTSLKPDFAILKNSFPFLLLGLTGMLGSRIDQYVVSYYLSKETLGEYQVLKSFMIYTHAGIGFALVPFLKNIYRLSDDKIDKLAGKLFILGLILFIPYMVFLYLIIKYLYGFNLNIKVYFYSALFVLPAYYYAVMIYKMFKNNKQSAVVLINALAVI